MGADASVAFKEFLLSALSYIPVTQAALLGGICFGRYWYICEADQISVDRFAFSLAVMTLSRSFIYEAMVNGGVNSANAEGWAFLFSLMISVLVVILLWVTRKTIALLILIAAAFVAFMFVYGFKPWPIWVMLAIAVVIIALLLLKKQVYIATFVFLSSLMYSTLLVYITSYLFFSGKDWTAFHDLVNDCQLGFDCAYQRWCLLRVLLAVMLLLLRVILVAVAHCCQRDAASKTELEKLEDNLDTIESKRAAEAAAKAAEDNV